MPFEQQGQGFGGEARRIAGIGKHLVTLASCCEILVIVAGYHIEIDTGKVALILVNRFKDIVVSRTAKRAVPHFAAEAVAPFHSACHLAVGPCRAVAVGLEIGRENMIQVGVHGFGITASPPRLGQGVFAVVALTLCKTVAATAISLGRERTIGIDIPDITVGVNVHICTVAAHIIIRQDSMVDNQRM